MTTREITCKRCGQPNLQWKQSKKGNWYLTEYGGTPIHGETGRRIKTIYPAHRCENWEKVKADDERWEPRPARNEAWASMAQSESEGW